MFMINHTESDLPRVNQPSRDRRQELDEQWTVLQKQSATLEKRIKKYNAQLWEAGVGAIWTK